MPDVVIVGGGVIGLATGWHLARSGISVSIVDAGPLGGQSSQAAAGILGPLTESWEDGPFTSLLWESLTLYPEWLQALAEDAHVDPEYDQSGILRLITEDEMVQYRASLAWRQRYDPRVEWVDSPRPGYAAAVWSPREAQILGPRYMKALAEACLRRGVDIRLGHPVLQLVQQGSRVSGVETTNGVVAGETVILAAGAWSGHLARHAGLSLPVHPIRGQVLGVRAPARPFSTILFGPDGYLAPKRDGLIVVGATEDLAGYDARVTMNGLHGLTTRLVRLAPELLSLPFDRAWAGLRPATADGLPYLGRWPGLSNLIVATGHYRNGLLLSPVTAHLTAALVTGQRVSRDLTPFQPDRHHTRGT